jgi:RHS repeat-associated protein
LTAGAHSHRFDSLGRAVAVDDLAITYGPNGQIASATRGAKSWSYVYDEAGRRAAKLVGSTIAALFLPDGSYVDATARTEPVRFAGSVVGVVKHPMGASAAQSFALVATDARGTSLSDAHGAERNASPFGDRDVHPDVAAAVDFAALGWDADLKLVRMGVRDYDPRLSRFTTPDPLYLEHVEKFVQHRIDGTLYAYARNNPLQVVDPTGQEGEGDRVDPTVACVAGTAATSLGVSGGLYTLWAPYAVSVPASGGTTLSALPILLVGSAFILGAGAAGVLATGDACTPGGPAPAPWKHEASVPVPSPSVPAPPPVVVTPVVIEPEPVTIAPIVVGPEPASIGTIVITADPDPVRTESRVPCSRGP